MNHASRPARGTDVIMLSLHQLAVCATAIVSGCIHTGHGCSPDVPLHQEKVVMSISVYGSPC